jgi:hypothetical protein
MAGGLLQFEDATSDKMAHAPAAWSVMYVQFSPTLIALPAEEPGSTNDLPGHGITSRESVQGYLPKCVRETVLAKRSENR